MLYIIGHTNPDLDTSVAALSLKYLFDKASCFERPNSRAVLAGKANFETETIFKKFKTPLLPVLNFRKIRPQDTFALVDHNEESQRLQGIKDEQITDIFDHHKAKLDLATPIFVNIKAWGSTTTVISWFMDTVNVKPPKKLASLMISAILSDTQGFKSNTTTEKDRLTVKSLNKIAQIKNLDKLTFEIFEAKSSLKGLNDRQILTKDYKLYDFKAKKVLLNQIETVRQDQVIKISSRLITELACLKREMNLNYAACIITDILKNNSKVLITKNEEPILKKAFARLRKVKTGIYDIGPLLSRKKDIAPKIERAI
ncbi:MAG TPA: DHHA2 domain-containing protein [Candidatus Bathyarchaeia archaeon]|nr:DHHA2 domain-containing protein [Candidatus Bathyarchaeia archaeon]